MAVNLRFILAQASATQRVPEPGKPIVSAPVAGPNTMADNTFVTIKEGADYGVVKVSNGQLVIDVNDFDADLGNF